MTDFWFNVLWTILIATATVISDWIASKFVILTRGFSAIQKKIDQSITDDLKLKDVRDEIDRAAKRAISSLIWGSDLVTVAIGLDLAVLGIWTADKSLFPFFQSWNTSTLNRESQVWLLVLIIHLVFMLISIVFKHLHGDYIESIDGRDLATPSQVFLWIPQNRWMLASNALGFFALLSCFTIISNSF